MQKYTRKLVSRAITADLSRLYGDLEKAAEYLLEIKARHPNATLYESWPDTDYEEISMSFRYMAYENDAEYAARVSLINKKVEQYKKDLERRSR